MIAPALPLTTHRERQPIKWPKRDNGEYDDKIDRHGKRPKVEMLDLLTWAIIAINKSAKRRFDWVNFCTRHAKNASTANPEATSYHFSAWCQCCGGIGGHTGDCKMKKHVHKMGDGVSKRLTKPIAKIQRRSTILEQVRRIHHESNDGTVRTDLDRKTYSHEI